MQDEHVPGRVIALTGAAGLLGQAMAIGLARAGHRVLLCDRREEALREVVEACAVDSSIIATCSADLTSATGAAEVEQRAIETFGHIDALVNNAALTGFAVWPDTDNQPNPWEVDGDTVRRFFDINVLAQHALIQRLLPGMIARGWGRIINVTCSYSTMQRLFPYGTTKAALEAYTAAIELNLANTGVTASTLNPGGPVRTPELVALNPEQTYWVDADVMNDALLWLVSSNSDGIPGARYIGSRWARGARGEIARYHGSGPMTWRGFGAAPA